MRFTSPYFGRDPPWLSAGACTFTTGWNCFQTFTWFASVLLGIGKVQQRDVPPSWVTHARLFAGAVLAKGLLMSFPMLIQAKDSSCTRKSSPKCCGLGDGTEQR